MSFHGSKGRVNLEQKDQKTIHDTIYAYEIGGDLILSQCSDVTIKNIDCLFCFSGSYVSKNGTKSVAIELLKATHAEAVYGVTGTLYYNFGYNQVWGGVYYLYYYDDQNQLRKKGGKLIFDVMERWNNERVPSGLITDYPE